MLFHCVQICVLQNGSDTHHENDRSAGDFNTKPACPSHIKPTGLFELCHGDVSASEIMVLLPL
jgi:hypothetical protein